MQGKASPECSGRPETDVFVKIKTKYKTES